MKSKRINSENPGVVDMFMLAAGSWAVLMLLTWYVVG
jgi:hypothetical protein